MKTRMAFLKILRQIKKRGGKERVKVKNDQDKKKRWRRKKGRKSNSNKSKCIIDSQMDKIQLVNIEHETCYKFWIVRYVTCSFISLS